MIEKIENQVEGKLPLLLYGDERRIKQVLINLVKNAKKFTLKGKIQINASYNEQTQSLVVHVNDTGVGISAEDLPRLFNKFGKLQRTADMNSDGIGLGLTIVQGIVESSGGEIVVRSPGLNKGSSFCFSMQIS